MINVRKRTWFVLVLLVSSMHATGVFAANTQHKPQPPLQISITPVQTPDTIKSGDVVDVKVSATSIIDTTEMLIQVKLADGAELISGDLSWTGSSKKKEKKMLFFAVRIPATGTGKILVTLTVSTGEGKSLSQSAQYLLLTGEQKQEQIEAQKKMKSTHPVRKDSKGKDVIEYQ